MKASNLLAAIQLLQVLLTGLLYCVFLGSAVFTEWRIQQRGERGIFFGVWVDVKFWKTVQGQEIFRGFSRVLRTAACAACGVLTLLLWHRPMAYLNPAWVIPVLLIAWAVSVQVGFARGYRQALPYAAPPELVRSASLRRPQEFSRLWQALYWTAYLVPALAVAAAAVHLHGRGVYEAPSGYEGFAASVRGSAAEAALGRLMRHAARTAFLLNYRSLLAAAAVSGASLWLAFAFLYRTRPADWLGDEEGGDRYQRQVMFYLAVLQALVVLQNVFLAVSPTWTSGRSPLIALVAPAMLILFYVGWRSVMGLRLYGKRPYGMVDRTQDERWKWGFYYFDRNDPAWIVPSRLGTRQTLNWGNPAVAFPLVISLCILPALFVLGALPSVATRTELRVGHVPPVTRSTRVVPRGDGRNVTVSLGRATATPPLEDGEWSVYRLAMDAVEDPRGDRRDAADVLVGFAETRPVTTARVAHVLASHGLRMDAVQRLAEQAVARVERGTAKIDKDNVTRADWVRGYWMAEAWDSLGWVYYQLGNLDAAERYCRSAWELGYQSLYLEHLLQISRKRGDKGEAENFPALRWRARDDYSDSVRLLSLLPVSDRSRFFSAPQMRPDMFRFEAAVKPLSMDGVVLLASGAAPELRVLKMQSSGKEARDVATLQKAVQTITFPVQLPDAGPEIVAQRVTLHCTGQEMGRCMLMSLPVWMGPGETARMQAELGKWKASAEE